MSKERLSSSLVKTGKLLFENDGFEDGNTLEEWRLFIIIMEAEKQIYVMKNGLLNFIFKKR